MRVHRERVDAMRRELVLLVLHQGDQRADDDGQSREHQRGKLIDDRFAAAGRHDDQRVTLIENGMDRLPLPLLKILMTEARRQETMRFGPKRLSHYVCQRAGTGPCETQGARSPSCRECQISLPTSAMRC